MSDTPIEKRLENLGRRLKQGAEKLHPLTKPQKSALRSALAAQLEKTHVAPKPKKHSTQEKPAQTKQQSKDKGQSHGH